MSEPSAAVPARRRRGPGRIPIGLAAVLAFSLLSVAAAVWGWLGADPQFRVFTLDAGAVDRFAVGRVVAFEELDLYVVGLESGRIRAVDGIVRGSGCAVRWLPDDRRALSANPRGAAGAFEDRCTGAVWAITGNAVAGTQEPLRTFFVTYRTDDAGVQHVEVEVLGRTPPAGPTAN